MLLFTDEFGCVQDELSGVRVRATNYRDLQAEADFYAEYNAWEAAMEREDEEICVPFVVLCWSEGGYTDLDDDGNEVWVCDGWPEWFVSTCHTTRKGAEIAVAYHEDRFPMQDVRIEANYWLRRWELQYHPIQENS